MNKSLPHEVYEVLADAYAAMVDTKPHNAFYERPATQSLIGDISGQAILDAGCGPGAYTEWLLGRGATVEAHDASQSMIRHARERVGDRAKFHHANLEEPLSFLSHDSFDGILSALTVAYVRDLTSLFAEFGRILRDGGWFVFSTEHPFFSHDFFDIGNYFDTQEVASDWHGFGEPVNMPGYYHSLGTISTALSENRFVIEKILEPRPIKEFGEVDPVRYDKLMEFPLFVCFRARKDDERPLSAQGSSQGII